MLMISKFATLSLILLLSACAHTPRHNAGEQDADEQAIDMAAILPSMRAAENDGAYPQMELNGQMLYSFLLADVAAQRGQSALAAKVYLELAKKTRDLRVVRRAAQLAYDAREMELTLEAFKLWHDLQPEALLPRQMLATVLVSGGRLEEARPYLVELLADDQKNADQIILQFYPVFARHADKQAVYKLLQELAKPYPDLAEMHWVLAQAAESSGRHGEALTEARKARALRPEWELSVLLEAQLQKIDSPVAALELTGKFLAKYPDANEVRLFYARGLLEQKQLEESRNQFKQLLKNQPDNAEVAFAIALLSMQMGELDRAEEELRQMLGAGKKDNATVHYYLAQLNEAKKNDTVALQEYGRVKDGEFAFPSRLRIAYLLLKSGKLEEALEILHKTEAKNKAQRAQLILTEGQILRDAKQYSAAFGVLEKGMKALPDQADLLYEAAMIADKQSRHEVAEGLLRKLIRLAPDHAHAYNALGYSLLERKIRLDEAMGLIEKAHQLAPDDASILDSMGWGNYLKGNLAKSEEYLRRAYAVFPDPEIAAHLGEVLWHKGMREEAKNIWQDNLAKNPGSMVLKAVIQKFIR